MDACQRHGITHFSASQLNLWRSAPWVYAYRYLAKRKDESGSPAMWRGTACETGLRAILSAKDVGFAVEQAHDTFDMNALGEISDEISGERSIIEPILRQLLHWQPPSDLNATQLRIEHRFDGVPVPIIGYLDFAFDGVDVDLKTTKALPSKPRPDHVRQVSLYRAARNRAGGLLYATDKRHAYYAIDDETSAAAVIELQATAKSLLRFLGKVANAEEAMAILPQDSDHYAFPKLRTPPATNLLFAG